MAAMVAGLCRPRKRFEVSPAARWTPPGSLTGMLECGSVGGFLIANSVAHASRIKTSSVLSSWQVKHMVPLKQVLSVLNLAEVDFVLAGAHAISGWTKKPRATVDVDVVIAPKSHRKAVSAVRKAFPELEVRDFEVVTRLIDPATGESVIDLMKPKDRLLRTVFENSIRLRLEGQPARIPDLEMAAALKFSAMVGIYREHPDKMQDAADFSRIIAANPKLSVERLARLSELVYAGGGAESRRLVEAVRQGKPLVF